MTITLDYFGCTLKGQERPQNGDQFLIADLRKVLHIEQGTIPPDQGAWLWGAGKRFIFAVADGLSTNPRGAQASKVATATLARYILNTMPWFYLLRDEEEDDLGRELETAMERANRAVELVGSESGGVRPPATTMSLAYVLWPRLYVVHVGNSRVHLLRGKTLHRLTTDHTAPQRAPGSRAVDASESDSVHYVLWNSLGGADEAFVTEVGKVILHDEDRLLLCTDGISDALSEREICETMLVHNRAEIAASALVSRAVDRQGADDATAVVCRFRSD